MEQELPPLDDWCKAQLETLRADGSDEIWRVRYILELRARQLKSSMVELIVTSKALELLCRFAAGTDRWESKRDEMLEMARRQLGKERS